MKRIYWLIVVLLTSVVMLAQTQQGYVKTKGRLGNNGSVIAGSRLSGATVQAKGSNAVVSGNNGSFTLAIASNSYYLQSVQKQGYVVTDPDVLSRQYAYSKNPLVLVLETPSQQTDDKLAAERKIRRTLQRQLQDREDEIEFLKEQQRISEEEYRRRLQDIYAQQESNEKLISEMADRYSKIDFDEVDEFNRRISDCIINGRLAEADSLLNTKGDINSRAAQLRQRQEAIAQTEQKLKKSKAMTQTELEELAQDCYSKFEIFKMQHNNDSAAYYIELRANLDTLNVDWMLFAVDFLKNYVADYEKALVNTNKALNTAIISNGGNTLWVAKAFNMLGCIYDDKGDYKQSIECFEKSLSIKRQVYGYENLDIADCLHNIGNVYSSLGKFANALEYYNKALNIRKGNYMNNSLEISQSYSGIGGCYIEMGQIDQALDYISKALEIKKSFEGERAVDVGLCMHNMALIYSDLKNYGSSLAYELGAVSIFEEIYGEKHPKTTACYMALGNLYKDVDSLKLAEYYTFKALSIYRKYSHNSIDVAKCYGNVANLYTKMGRFDDAIDYNKRSLSLLKEKLGDKHPVVAMVYTNMGTTYLAAKKYEEALKSAHKSLDIFEKVFGVNHPYSEQVIRNIAEIERKMKNN